MNSILRVLQVITLCLYIFPGIILNAQTSDKDQSGLRDRIFEKPDTRILSNTKALKWLKNTLNSEGTEWEIIKEKKDELGYKHLFLQQTHNGYPVLGGEIKLHFNQDGLYLANGFYSAIKLVENKISLNKDRAINHSLEANPSNQYIWECQDNFPMTNPEIYIVPVKDEEIKYYYTYKVDVYSVDPLFRYDSYISSDTGLELEKHSKINHNDANGVAHTMYSGIQNIITDSVSQNVFNLKNDIGGGIHTKDMNQTTTTESEFIDSDNIWTSTLNDDHAALDVHWGITKTYNYFHNTHSHDSFDDNDAPIKSRVHYDADYANAFWDGTQLTFGDGDDSFYTTAFTSLDIVGHEFTHGVVQHTAGLINSNESGALNESFADIFGVCIDFATDSSQANYLIGDEIYTTNGSLRNMEDPNDNFDPDTYYGGWWYIGSVDNGGVHTNSGVQNYWFYLLAEGGSGTNDNNDNFNITGIGRLKASKIAFRSLNLYLSSNSDYADARIYAIQAATDLYGGCSTEVIATTNAWHAVGVGPAFTTGITANFSSDNNYHCTLPLTVSFINNSTNGISYTWDFGDGTTSTDINPSHTYTSVGSFDVQLITTADPSCIGEIDTLNISNYITIDTTNNILPADCNSAFQFDNFNFINQFDFGSISKTIGYSGSNIEDFTCTNHTEITEGVFTNISASTFSSSLDEMKIWLDYNNSGDFDDSEVLTYSPGNGINHYIQLNHDNIVHNTPLRLRAICGDDLTTDDACYSNFIMGQQQDYSVTILENTNPPIADFYTSDTSLNAGTSTQFIDSTNNLPTSWLWSFPGGTPSTSTVQDPAIYYNNVGNFDVQLITTNSFGSDTVLYTNHISVTNFYFMCNDSSTVSQNGTLYDSGGPDGNYMTNENCSFIIGQDCVDSIHLSLEVVNLHYNHNLKIYSGNTADPSNELFSGNSSNGQDFIIADSYALIQFTSGYNYSDSGFVLHWNSISLDTTSPTVDFTFTDTLPVNTLWEFTSVTSSDVSTWEWILDDYYVANDSIATLSIDSPGLHNLSLIGTNCNKSDTISHSVYVQEYPYLNIQFDTIFTTINCADSIVLDSILFVENTGYGDAIIQLEPEGAVDSIDILAMTQSAPYSGYYLLFNALNDLSDNVNITDFDNMSVSAFEDALEGKEIVLFPQIHVYFGSLTYSAHAEALENYVKDGGHVIFMGSDLNNSAPIFSTGLWSGSYYSTAYNTMLNIDLPYDPLLDSVTAPIMGGPTNYVYNLTDSNITNVVSYNGKSYLAYKTLEKGKVFYFGSKFTNSTADKARIIHNIVQQSHSNEVIIPDSLLYTLSPQDSVYIPFTISSDQFYPGTNHYSISVNTNDSIGNYEIPVVITVVGTSDISGDTSCIIFEPIYTNVEDSTTYTIHNFGCTAEVISNIYASDTTVFTINPNSVIVPPYSSKDISIHFISDSAATFNETLHIIAQNDTLSVCLKGETVPAPIIDLGTDTIPVQYVSCYDELSVNLTVYNTGLSDLEYSANFIGGAPFNLISFSHGSSFLSNNDMKIALENSGLNYNLFEYSGTNEDSIDHYLEIGDMLIIPSLISNSNLFDYNVLTDKIENFVNDGGHIVVLGTSMYEIYHTDLFNGTFVGTQYNTTTNLTPLAAASLLENTSPPYLTETATHYHNFQNANQQNILTYGNYDVCTSWPYGSGNVTYIGYSYYFANFYSENSITLLKNAVYANYISDEVTFLPDSGTIAAGDSMLIQLNIDITNYQIGTHTETVEFYSNDPANPVTQVQFTIVKDSAACPDFYKSKKYVNIGDTISFFDQSLNSPTAWSWTFENGSSNTSTLQNPIKTYYVGGLHNVTLEVSNDVGSYSITKEDYVYVDHLYNMCESTETNYTTGILFDSGGELDHYQPNENCSFLINPDCADSILLNIESMDLDPNGSLIIYDGTDTTGSILYNSINPTIDTAIVSTTGSVFVNFSTMYFWAEGFEIKWDTYISPGNSGTANFVLDNSNPANGSPIQLTSTCSSDIYEWLWNFGDNFWSTLENPTHAYSAPGIYEIMLIGSNCYGSDTSYSSITVQDYPQINGIPDSIYKAIDCFSVDSFLLTFENTAGGNMEYYLDDNFIFNDTSQQYLTYTGEDLNHYFTDIPNDLDSLHLKVQIQGDYSSSSEYVGLYIDNVFHSSLSGGADNVLYTYDIILTGFDLQNYLADGSINVTTNNSSNVSYDPNFENSNVVTIEYDYNLSNYYSFNDDVHQLSVGEIDSTWLYFNMTNYNNGLYETAIMLFTNDSTASYEIPITIDVIGLPDLQMDTACLDFGTIQAGMTSNANFTITNNGCANLEIINVTSTYPGLDWISLPTTVPPNDSSTIELTYNSNSIGDFSGNIIIHTNSVSNYRCITGEVVLGSMPSFVNGVLTDSIECNSSAVEEQTFTITNVGDEDLSIQSTGLTNSIPGVSISPSTIIIIPTGQGSDFTLSITSALISPGVTNSNLSFSSNSFYGLSIPLILTNNTNSIIQSFYYNMINFGQASFTNTTTGNIDSVLWDFGDGTTSIQSNPIHTYATEGEFTVTLFITDNCGEVTSTSQSITIDLLAVDELKNTSIIYPNPTTGSLHITKPNKIEKIEVYSINGKSLLTYQLEDHSDNLELNLKGLSKGNYLLYIYSKDKIEVTKILLK